MKGKKMYGVASSFPSDGGRRWRMNRFFLDCRLKENTVAGWDWQCRCVEKVERLRRKSFIIRNSISSIGTIHFLHLLFRDSWKKEEVTRSRHVWLIAGVLLHITHNTVNVLKERRRRVRCSLTRFTGDCYLVFGTSYRSSGPWDNHRKPIAEGKRINLNFINKITPLLFLYYVYFVILLFFRSFIFFERCLLHPINWLLNDPLCLFQPPIE